MSLNGNISIRPFNFYPIMRMNCKLFKNVLLGEYVTIHITPEPQFSYVSFESNVPASSYLNIVNDILNTFNPGKFILTIFATKVERFTSNLRCLELRSVADLRSGIVTQRAESIGKIWRLDKN